MADSLREVFGYLAAVISLAAYPIYIVEYIGGRTKTHSLTRWMWKYLGLKGNTKIALGYLVGSTINTLLLFKYGSKKWSMLDYVCSLLAVGSIVLLYQNRELAFWALVLAITTDAIAAIPTIWSVTKTSTNEGRAGWTIFLIGALVNLFTIKTWNFQEAGFTIYLITVIGYIVLKTWFPKKTVIV